MALIMGNATVPTSGTVPLFFLPAGQCNVTFWNPSTSGTAYVGSGTAVSSANGLQCHSIPTSFNTYIGNKGMQLYAVSNGTPCTVQYILNSSF